MTLSADPRPDTSLAGDGQQRPSLWRAMPLAIALVAAAAVYGMGWHRELSLEALVQHRAAVDGFIAANALVAVFAYVAAVILALSGGLLVTTIGGFLFGIALGGVGGVVGATIGATAMFVVAKTAFGGRLFGGAGPIAARLIKGFRDDAFNYVVCLRLTPVPFQVVNLVPALLNIPLRTFLFATALGVVPTRIVFAAFGASLDALLASQIGIFDACRTTGGTDCRIELDLSAALSPQIIALLAAACAVALIPVGLRHWRNTARATPPAVSADG